MIKYSLVKRRNLRHPEQPRKFSASAQSMKTLTLEILAKYIRFHRCAYKEGDFIVITRMLKEGYRVELDDLGVFYLTLGCEGAESRETFNPDKHIKEVRVNWAPGEAFENIREGITFEETIDRRTERKLLRMGRNEESKDGIILRRNRLTT